MDNFTIKGVTLKAGDGALFTNEHIPVFVVGISLSTLSLYLLIAAIAHRVKKNKAYRKSTKLTTRSSRARKASASPRLDNTLLAAVALAFLNCSSDHPIVFTSQTTHNLCKIMQLFSFLFYAAGITCLYTFLWLRQRGCYEDPTLALTYSKPCRIASACILPIFLVMMVAGIVLTGAVWSFESSNNGCLETTKKRAPLAVLFAGSFVMQITLEFLFIFPIKRHAKNFFAKSSQRSTDRILVSLVKRSVITTIVCILADLATFTSAMFLEDEIPFVWINYLYDANLLCNVICVTGSFADWRSRLRPFCVKKKSLEGKINSSLYSSSVKTSSTTIV